MTLAALELPTEEIRVGKSGSFSVRGLSFSEVALLMQNDSAELEKMFGLFTSKKKGSVDTLLKTLLSEMPGLAAKIIALAADEPGQDAKVKKLPAPTQLTALMAIGRMTFEETGGVKKFIEQVVSLLAASNTVIHDLLLSTPSQAQPNQ